MNRSDMRTTFKERTGNLADSLPDDVIETRLNRAYQYGVAAEVPGSLTEGEWSVTTQDTVATYDYDDEVYEVRDGARIGTTWLSMYFRKSQFEYDHSSTSSNSKPYAALFYGRQVKFYPTPDDEYTMTVPARLYPDTSIPSAGLTNHNHAMAVVCEAAREFLMENDEADKAARQAADLAIYLSRLRGASLGRVRERRARLSF